MIRPKIRNVFNPATGETVQQIRYPNIFICGLTREEKDVLIKSLPEKETEITDVSEDVCCIVEKDDFAIVINTDNTTDKDLDFFEDFYKDFDGCTETIILLGTQKKYRFGSVKTVSYKDIFEMKRNIKYDLLKAYHKTMKSEGYYEKLSMILKILFAIRNNPYITTKELSDMTERSTRTVQRYIETLRCAGEFIGYDRQNKGWYLMMDYKSLLMNEI